MWRRRTRRRTCSRCSRRETWPTWTRCRQSRVSGAGWRRVQHTQHGGATLAECSQRECFGGAAACCSPPGHDSCAAADTPTRAAAKLPTVRRLRDAIYATEFREFISHVTGGWVGDRGSVGRAGVTKWRKAVRTYMLCCAWLCLRNPTCPRCPFPRPWQVSRRGPRLHRAHTHAHICIAHAAQPCCCRLPPTLCTQQAAPTQTDVPCTPPTLPAAPSSTGVGLERSAAAPTVAHALHPNHVGNPTPQAAVTSPMRPTAPATCTPPAATCCATTT